MFKLNNNIIINSNGIGFIFNLTEKHDIQYTVVDSSFNILDSVTLIKEKVLKYSVIIDSKDILHLLVLLNNGDLVYYQCVDNLWSHSIIGNFDIKSNYYNQIEILMIKNQIHIMYSFSNLISSNLWNLQHVIYENQEKHNIIQYIASKNPDPFVVDFDSQGTIYLLYSATTHNKTQIYYNFYNPFTNSWSSRPKIISSDRYNNHYPLLFIDSIDNIHSLWLEESKNKYFLRYIKMNSRGKEKFIWKEIKLSIGAIDYLPPIIYQEKNILKLQISSNNKIRTFISEDFGDTWLEYEDSLINENIILSRINCNLEPHINKFKYGFNITYPKIEFHFLDSYFHKQNNKIEEIEKGEENKEIEDSGDIEDISVKEYPQLEKIQEQIDRLEILNNIINSILKEQNLFQSQLDHVKEKQQILEEKLFKLENTIQEHETSWFKKLFK